MSKLNIKAKKISIVIFITICSIIIINSKHNLGIYTLFTDPFSISHQYYLITLIVIVFALFFYHIMEHVNIILVTKKHSFSIRNIVDSFFSSFIIFFLLFSLPYILSQFESQREISLTREKLIDEITIIHAGGIIQDSNGMQYTYTNSYEALSNCYSLNNHIIELDFAISKDNILVCSHEQDLSNVTSSDFLRDTLPGGFTPLSLNDVINFLKLHQDVYIVTDAKRYNPKALTLLGQNVPDELKKRFIVQIYNKSEYSIAIDNGFNNVIFTLYLLEGEDKDLDNIAATLKSCDILAVTFFENRLTETDFYNTVYQLGVPMCVHTVNDHQDMINDITQYHVTGIYTDNTDNQWLRDKFSK